MILKLLTGGIDLPKLAADVRVLRDELITARGRQTDENNKYTAPYASLNARLDDIEEEASDAMLIAHGTISDIEDVNKALADHIANAHEQLASRALAEDVETLRLMLDRLKWDITGPFTAAGTPTLATDVADLQTANATLAALVASLTKQVEALTAAKLSDVKARKAPRKDAAK